MTNESTLLCLRVWHHNGLVHYEEHTGSSDRCLSLVREGLKRPGAYQARCTSYRFGAGSVVNAYSEGSVSSGWRF